jgi:hypothetical protein
VRKKLAVLVTIALMLAMMMAMAMPAFAQGGAAGKCGPPGQGVRIYARTAGESVPGAYGGPPGEAVRDVCAPGQK